MSEATLSSKYQLVIPKEVRDQTGVSVGEKMIIIAKDGVINLIPEHRVKSLRGFLKGTAISTEREDGEDRV
ncbi:MAG: AbrB/MazE/SpoVT family DNA-binding domain-containing protein [Myxococcota bacterium]|jgi:AbrB family looped-hinge helix DNA binding protein